MLGDRNGLFRPGDAVTRAEMASIVSRLLPASAPDNAGTAAYSDIQSHWAADAIEAVSRAGIFSGYPEGVFKPENKLNRAEAVAVLNRLFERPAIAGQASNWPDVPQSHWALKDIVSASNIVIQLPDGSAYIE